MPIVGLNTENRIGKEQNGNFGLLGQVALRVRVNVRASLLKYRLELWSEEYGG
jgi:hypothetical protein